MKGNRERNRRRLAGSGREERVRTEVAGRGGVCVSGGQLRIRLVGLKRCPGGPSSVHI